MRTQPKFPLPQPQPTTPIRGRGIVPCDFKSPALRRLAKRLKTKLNSKWAVLKPQRNSRGVIWRNNAYWWSTKGYYRNGKAGGDRRPLHHLIWEHLNGRPIPEKHEIFFRDRDYHNFTKSNLELLPKREMYRRLFEIGERKQISDEQRQRMATKRWTRHGNRLTDLLLNKFNTGDSTVAASLKGNQ